MTSQTSKRYRKPRNKEFICNLCHKHLKSGIFLTHKEHSKNYSTQSSHNSTNNNKHHFDLTSLHATQNPQVTNCCLCTCCHKPDILRKQCVIFNIQRYNVSNQIVSQALSSRISVPTAKEFICKKCDKSLAFGQMPIDAEVPYNYKHLNKGTLCISCKTQTTDKTHIFDKAEYGENILVDKIVPSDTSEENIICNKCHNKMLMESVVTCVICDERIPRHFTYICDNKKYSSIQHYIKVTIPQKCRKRYMCKTCHVQLQPQFICVCCALEVDMHLCILYVKDNYDFTQYVVSRIT